MGKGHQGDRRKGRLTIRGQEFPHKLALDSATAVFAQNQVQGPSYIAPSLRLTVLSGPASLASEHSQLHKETDMPDLNDANPTPPQEAQAKLEKSEQESRKLDSPARTNDSTIDPERPKEDILKGFHGG